MITIIFNKIYIMKSFPIIGLMSGTSIDGIDASLIYSNGRRLKELNLI